jgi:hypothetical protein
VFSCLARACHVWRAVADNQIGQALGLSVAEEREHPVGHGRVGDVTRDLLDALNL